MSITSEPRLGHVLTIEGKPRLSSKKDAQDALYSLLNTKNSNSAFVFVYQSHLKIILSTGRVDAC